MDLKERGSVDVDWIHLAQNRGQYRYFVKTVTNLRVP